MTFTDKYTGLNVLNPISSARNISPSGKIQYTLTGFDGEFSVIPIFGMLGYQVGELFDEFKLYDTYEDALSDAIILNNSICFDLTMDSYVDLESGLPVESAVFKKLKENSSAIKVYVSDVVSNDVSIHVDFLETSSFLESPYRLKYSPTIDTAISCANSIIYERNRYLQMYSFMNKPSEKSETNLVEFEINDLNEDNKAYINHLSSLLVLDEEIIVSGVFLNAALFYMKRDEKINRGFSCVVDIFDYNNVEKFKEITRCICKDYKENGILVISPNPAQNFIVSPTTLMILSQNNSIED